MRFSRHPVAKYLDSALTGRGQQRFERHLQRCPRCAEQVSHEREVQQLLRGSSAPAPSRELMDRIRSRRGADAALENTALGNTALGNAALDDAGKHPAALVSGSSHRLVAAVGSLTVVVLAMLSGIYVMSGAARVSDAAAAGVAVNQQLAPAWDNPEMIPADLHRLRKAGWNCPALSTLGYRLEAARGYEQDGVPTLEIVLRKDDSTVVVYEQRKSASRQSAAGGRVLNIATGKQAAPEEFVPVPMSEGSGAGPQLWLRYGHPSHLVFDHHNARYTIVADLPMTDLAKAARRIAMTELSQLAQTPATAVTDPDRHDVLRRIWQGLASPVQ